MKNTNTLLLSAMMLCVNACSSGALYFPVPAGNDPSRMPLSPVSSPSPSPVGPDTTPPDLSNATPTPPSFAPTIDGNVFMPTAVFFATGQDAQNHPVLMVVVTDQNDLCTQATQSRVLPPGAGALALYLYKVDATGGTGSIVAPDDYAGSYAVFDGSIPGSDVTGAPAQHIPMDTGLYTSGTFFRWSPQCTHDHAHQVAEGNVTITALDPTNAKAAGSISVLLEGNISLLDNGAFVAQACPALQTITTASGCMLP